MTITQLEVFAGKNGIIMFDAPLPDVKAMSIVGGCMCLDSTLIETCAEKRVILAHEIGHHMTGSFYNVYSSFDNRAKHEYRADKWATHKLMPLNDVKTALHEGYDTPYDLAEYFNLPYDFVIRAMDIYQRQGHVF